MATLNFTYTLTAIKGQPKHWHGIKFKSGITRDEFKGTIEQTKGKRYWPGKAPESADDADEEESRLVPFQKSVVVMKDNDQDDPRLRRLAKTTRVDDKEELRASRKRIRQEAEVVSTMTKEEGDTKDDDDDMEERRRKIREKLLQRQQEEVQAAEEEEELESESESEYETDLEEEIMGIAMVRPVFVRKTERETVAERERVEEEARMLEERMKKRMEERKAEIKQIVLAEIRKEDSKLQESNLAGDMDVDTDEEVNEAEEYEAWKVREMARIKTEREGRNARLKEKEEIERLRKMTEEERRVWERNNPKLAPQPKNKFRFMQRYYHKGSFFQSAADNDDVMDGSDDIYQRDYNLPTAEDKTDKTRLPKVMQVKKFGRRGATKWTHLFNEDTTLFNEDKTRPSCISCN